MPGCQQERRPTGPPSHQATQASAHPCTAGPGSCNHQQRHMVTKSTGIAGSTKCTGAVPRRLSRSELDKHNQGGSATGTVRCYKCPKLLATQDGSGLSAFAKRICSRTSCRETKTTKIGSKKFTVAGRWQRGRAQMSDANFRSQKPLATFFSQRTP